VLDRQRGRFSAVICDGYPSEPNRGSANRLSLCSTRDSFRSLTDHLRCIPRRGNPGASVILASYLQILAEENGSQAGPRHKRRKNLICRVCFNLVLPHGHDANRMGFKLGQKFGAHSLRPAVGSSPVP